MPSNSDQTFYDLVKTIIINRRLVFMWVAMVLGRESDQKPNPGWAAHPLERIAGTDRLGGAQASAGGAGLDAVDIVPSNPDSLGPQGRATPPIRASAQMRRIASFDGHQFESPPLHQEVRAN